MAKNRVTPSFSYYMDELKEEQPIKTILMGHLVVEALLVEVINIKLNDKEFDAFELSFPKKVDLCVSLGLLNRTKNPAYLKLNSLRNRFAHRLGYQFTLKDAVDYANELNEMGFCFSDNNILEKDPSKQYYDIDTILIEILNWLTIELECTLLDHGKEGFDI